MTSLPTISHPTAPASSEIDRLQRDALAAEYRRLFFELKEERYRILRPLYRNLVRSGADLLRNARADELLNFLKTFLPNTEGVVIKPAHCSQAESTACEATAQKISLDRVRSSLNGPDVFVFSLIPWNYRRQRPQHLAYGLSRESRVFYIEPRFSPGEAVVIEHAQGLYSIQLPRSAGGNVRLYSGIPRPYQIRRFSTYFSTLIRRLGVDPNALLVVQHPFWWPYVKAARAGFRIIYDCMDDLSGFSNTTAGLLPLERDLIATANACVVSSSILAGLVGPRTNLHVIRNACDAALLSRGKSDMPWPSRLVPPKQRVEAGTRIRAGYVGAVAEWLDIDMLRNTVVHNPDIELHICGREDTQDAARLVNAGNVVKHGEVTADEAAAVMSSMDVMLIPFRITPLTMAADPIKYYEHCALGKPTVSTLLPELCDPQRPVVLAGERGEFASFVRLAASQFCTPNFTAELQAYASMNTWTHRVAQYRELFEAI